MIEVSPDTERDILKGCYFYFKKNSDKSQVSIRKSNQEMLPLDKPATANGYDIYPAYNIGENKIASGFSSLADKLI